MSDYDELYEDDFEEEAASVGAKSFTGCLGPVSTSNRTSPAMCTMPSNGGLATATAASHGRVAEKKAGVKGAQERRTSSLGSSFSSYQSAAADPLLPSAHELCSSSSHSSISSSRDHVSSTRPTEGVCNARSVAQAADTVVVPSGGIRASASPANCSSVTPASTRSSAPQTPEQYKVASMGARDVYAAPNGRTEVQVDAGAAVLQPHRSSPSNASEATSTAASPETSFSSSPCASSLSGRPVLARRRISPTESGSILETDAKLPQSASAPARASRSPSASSNGSYDDASDRGRRRSTSQYPSAAAAAAEATPSAAKAAGAVTPVMRDVSADRHHSQCGSNTSSSCSKALHQSNYTSVVVLRDGDDDRGHRRTPAEIDATAAAIDDEKRESVGDGDASATIVPAEAAVPQRRLLNTSLSDAYSDSFTSPSSSHAVAKSSSFSISPTACASSRHASLLGGPSCVGASASVVESLPSTHQQQPPSPPRVLAGAVPPGRSVANSSSSPKGAAFAVKSPASHSRATISRSALCAASSKTRAAGGAAVRGQNGPRQISVAAGKTADVQLFNGVLGSLNSRAASADDENSNNGHVEKPQNNVSQKCLPSPQRRFNSSRSSTPSSKDVSLPSMVIAAVKCRSATSTIAAEGNHAPEPDELTALLARVAHLREELATWDSRIARQRASVELGEGRSGRGTASLAQCHSADAAGAARRRRSSSDVSRRAESVAQARLEPIDTRGDRRPSSSRLAKLRQENERLEHQYARHDTGAAGMSVQTLVVRAEIQLQKVREQLKVVTAARRALENRDKRAAHTIEEVHRRMPTASELQERQLNEGIYSRTGLLRTVKELKANVERTRAATGLMEAKCRELEAQVRRKKLASITPREYEGLRATRDANAKTIEKHKTAILVYATASAQDARSSAKAAPSGGFAGGSATYSNRSSRTTSPRSCAVPSSRVGEKERKRQHKIGETEVLNAEFVLQQKKTLMNRKQELQAKINDLWGRVQRRDEQIKANMGATGLNYFGIAGSAVASGAPFYVVGGTGSASLTPATTSPFAAQDVDVPAAESGAAAARKRSLRDVLRTPVKRRTEEVTVAPSLLGAITPARMRSQDSVTGAVSGAHCGLHSALPALEHKGKRTVHAEGQPSLSALTALADSPVERSAQKDSSSAVANGAPASAAAAGTNAQRSSVLTLSRDAIEAEVSARDRIEADRCKANMGDRQLGQGAPEQKRKKEAARPTLSRRLDGADRVKAVSITRGDGDVFEEEPVPDEAEEAECGCSTRTAGQCGHFTGAAVRPRGVYTKDLPGQPLMDEAGEEQGATKSSRSGRSTPEWLRED
ncbi:hypothetical protein LSCM1_06290 [Leishmania martiniquensis]|uniref:Uncharacterized protein n=1 Tax=Leishmania martiniquensis TaxID=1580590 RepID=A0A836GSL4_9TRYP|nr:hypothetical protein LSCM1_06290 [Leishmania martiniquensis]